MIGGTIRRLAADLDSRIGGMQTGERCLLGRNYRTFEFAEANFHTILPAPSERRIVFIDGGNQEIVRAPNFSIQLNRVYFNIFKSRKRWMPRRIPSMIEFFSTTEAVVDDDYLNYRTKVFPVRDEFAIYLPKNQDLVFDTRHEAVLKNRSVKISKIASVARRFAEWSFAKHIIDEELSASDILVMDGSLQARYSQEIKYARDSYSSAQEKEVVYTGLAKTSRLVTNSGMSLLGAIRHLAIESGFGGSWFYNPVAESLTTHHEAEMFIVKLNDHWPRAFRYDIYKEQAKQLADNQLMEILTILCSHSSDAAFPGYPYGLVDADDNARVKNEEVETCRTMLLSEISRLGSWPKFQKEIESLDAHDLLDFLKGGSM